MVEQSTRYAMRTTMELPFELALDRTRKALAREGFGILSEIDMATALKQKLDVTFRPYVILGACNSQLAHRALTLEHELGLLLPCNVVVYAEDEQGNSAVAALDPVEDVLPATHLLTSCRQADPVEKRQQPADVQAAPARDA